MFFKSLTLRWNFKISSWNVDGVRACAKKGGAAFLEHEAPDILCLQETKVRFWGMVVVGTAMIALFLF